MEAPENDIQKVLEEIRTLYERKNHDYGNSFSKSFGEFGLLSPVIRLSDKVERLKTLCKAESKVNESVEDTLIDISLYAILTLVELNKRKE